MTTDLYRRPRTPREERRQQDLTEQLIATGTVAPDCPADGWKPPATAGPQCGCNRADQPDGCDVRFDRNAGQPYYQCAWDCRRHRAARDDGSREPGDTAGDAAGPPDDGLHAGAAACGPLTADGTGRDQQPGADSVAAPEPAGGPLWTPDLRAALEGLMPGTARRA